MFRRLILFFTTFLIARLAITKYLHAQLMIFGSFRYMAPERVDGVETTAGDVFGLGLGLIALGLTLLIRYHRDLQNS